MEITNKQEYKKPEVTELSTALGTAGMSPGKTDAGGEIGMGGMTSTS